MHVATKDAEPGTSFKFENQRIKHSVTRGGKVLQLFPALRKKWPSLWGLLGSSTQSRKQDLYEYGKLLIKWVRFLHFQIFFFLSMSISFWKISSYWLSWCFAVDAAARLSLQKDWRESWSSLQALHLHTFIKHSGISLPDYCAYTTV